MKLHIAPEARRKVRTGPSAGAAGSGSPELRATDPPEGLRGRIAVLVYQLYEQRGREDGHELEDWLEAERRILDRMT